MTIPTCKYCRTEMHDKCERVTGICLDCMAASVEIAEEFEENWGNFLHERDETVEANQ